MWKVSKLVVRRGTTLVEVLVIVGILAVLIGLLLPAIQAVRASAARAALLNTARQLLLATQQYADGHDGLLPDCNGGPPEQGSSVPHVLCKQMTGDGWPPPFLAEKVVMPMPPGTHPPPTPDGVDYGPPFKLLTGFAFNPMVYKANSRLPTSVFDGLANTVALTEHLKLCGPNEFSFATVGGGVQVFQDGPLSTYKPRVGMNQATFADYPQMDDVRPVTTVHNGVSVTVGSELLTFQVQPSPDQCNPRIPNSSLPGGILAGMFDGSARFVRPGVAPEVFWGSVTPAGGESVSFD